jgi:aromatic ring-opening dioxygenase catalytic subunit (LigB family)
LFIGSGGIVHNLSLVSFDAPEGWVDPWAGKFDRWVWNCVKSRDDFALFKYRQQAEAAMAVPVWHEEHFDPVFAVLGAAGEIAVASSIFEGFAYANLSLRCFALN